MGRLSLFFQPSRGSGPLASLDRKLHPLLPSSQKHTPKIRIRNLLGHCHYRRVILWTISFLFLSGVALLKTSGGKGYQVGGYHFSFPKTTGVTTKAALQPDYGDAIVVKGDFYDGKFDIVEKGEVEGEEYDQALSEEELAEVEEELEEMPWLRFPHLNGYFHGLKTIVKKTDLTPEYPNMTDKAPLPPPPKTKEAHKPTKYVPYEDDYGASICYLDSNETIPAPDIYAYNGVPQNMPDPAIGSYETLGLRDDVCFDRFGRYGPYGLGYSKRRGGSGSGLDTESSGNEEVWAETGRIDYSNMDWASAQEQCYEANKHRFKMVDSETDELEEDAHKKGRIAVVVRTYTGFKWTELAILNFRAMINELSLRSGGEYDVHFLLHVRNTKEPIFADQDTVDRIVQQNIPPEFHNLVTVWSEPQMKLFYPGEFNDPYLNPAYYDLHGVYRSAHLPLQVFATQHPEYEHFWNWEMDMRYVGSYYEFFDRIGKWAADQPRPLIWERSARYYIPSHHGSWKDFATSVQRDVIRSGRGAVLGPVPFEGRKKLRREDSGKSNLPRTCDPKADWSKCGVGEDADIITLNPLFDPDESGWVFAYDATGYPRPPPRRSAIVTASRLSRRLLMAMHEEVSRHHHTMFSEMFPPSVALHHGFKGVFAPHPVFLDRAWYPFGEIDAAFNGGRHHTTSGHGSPFDIRNEHNHRGTSWYYNSEFSGLLWRRWLGYAQYDGRGRFGGEGKRRGGKREEMEGTSSGRMCLRGMLVHPIKYEHPNEWP